VEANRIGRCRWSGFGGGAKGYTSASDRPTPHLESLPWLFCSASVLHVLFLGFFRAQFRRPKALMYLGRISYGLYVYQTFFLLIFLYGRHHTSGWKIFPFALLILILTIFIASLSYYFVERPFLRLKQRFTFINSTKIS
jgi:peptidoglycan/LPS O-acetylase OafA/YrhL